MLKCGVDELLDTYRQLLSISTDVSNFDAKKRDYFNDIRDLRTKIKSQNRDFCVPEMVHTINCDFKNYCACLISITAKHNAVRCESDSDKKAFLLLVALLTLAMMVICENQNYPQMIAKMQYDCSDNIDGILRKVEKIIDWKFWDFFRTCVKKTWKLRYCISSLTEWTSNASSKAYRYREKLWSTIEREERRIRTDSVVKQRIIELDMRLFAKHNLDEKLFRSVYDQMRSSQHSPPLLDLWRELLKTNPKITIYVVAVAILRWASDDQYLCEFVYINTNSDDGNFLFFKTY